MVNLQSLEQIISANLGNRITPDLAIGLNVRIGNEVRRILAEQLAAVQQAEKGADSD